MSIGRNKGSKSSSETNESNQQTTNYGAGDTTAVSAGNAKSVTLETLDDDVVNSAFSFAGENNKLFAKNFSELVGFTEREAKRTDETLDDSLGAIETIAKDKATGVQQAQKMAVVAVVGVIGAGLLFTNRKKSA